MDSGAIPSISTVAHKLTSSATGWYDLIRYIEESGIVPVRHLKTVMRMAMTSNIFFEPEVGEVSHTATLALLVKSLGLHD